MTNFDAAEIINFAREATVAIGDEAKEDAVRSLLSSSLPLMFPDKPWWILDHWKGAGAMVQWVLDGSRRFGFIDTLIGRTVVEFKRNLLAGDVLSSAQEQIKQYCSGLLNEGVPREDIFGVLSDTIRWRAFGVAFNKDLPPHALIEPADIKLKLLGSVDLDPDNYDTVLQYVQFVERYLGRLGSRPLDSLALARDLGFESGFYKGHIDELKKVVNKAFAEKEFYGKMISNLWQKFINTIDLSINKEFNSDDYSNKFYIVTIAKILCASFITNSVIEEKEVVHVLNGDWFKRHGFKNLVEYDYFGWLNEHPFVDEVAVIAKKMLHDLSAFDFKNVATGDLFGPLLAQLAGKESRLLLGQESTPQWMAKKIVARVLDELPKGEHPKILDMCCGSGVFLVETLKQTIAKLGLLPGESGGDSLSVLAGCAVGFDVDPVAVLVAKTNWVLTMRRFMGDSPGSVVIPVFHADSLLVSTPASGVIKGGLGHQAHRLVLDGMILPLPDFLISPDNRNVFDSVIMRANSIAKDLAEKPAARFNFQQAAVMVREIAEENSPGMDEGLVKQLMDWGFSLISVLKKIHEKGCNGIWPFLIVNGYRPSLIGAPFNAIISNPPWMAMSKLANNPYKRVITSRAKSFGILPAGSSHLHLELATFFLLISVDQYLKDDGIFSVIMPETLLNGKQHHEFRTRKFIESERKVPLCVDEIWKLPEKTFKNQAIVLFGRKTYESAPDPIVGLRVSDDAPDVSTEYRLEYLDENSTAWTTEPSVVESAGAFPAGLPFFQGADIMPRPLVFHKAVKFDRKWSLKPILEEDKDFIYLLDDAKKYTKFSLYAQDIDDRFIFDCFLSKHLTPFHVSEPAKAFLPMRLEGNRWIPYGEPEIAALGGSNRVAFQAVFDEAELDARGFFDKINYRNKLAGQFLGLFPDDHHLVLSGAGGGIPCAASVKLGALDKSRTIIDQTLYWHVVQSRDEALYTSGLLNSGALASRIKDYQPKGVFGERHVHKLPFRVIPPYDPGNESHRTVVDAVDALLGNLYEESRKQALDEFRRPIRYKLDYRRREIRMIMAGCPESADFEAACRKVLFRN